MSDFPTAYRTVRTLDSDRTSAGVKAMTADMPERIWARQNSEFLAGIEIGYWAEACIGPDYSAYVRADLHEVMVAENKRLREAIERAQQQADYGQVDACNRILCAAMDHESSK